MYIMFVHKCLRHDVMPLLSVTLLLYVHTALWYFSFINTHVALTVAASVSHGSRLGEELGVFVPLPRTDQGQQFELKYPWIVTLSVLLLRYLESTSQIAAQNTFNPNGSWKTFEALTIFTISSTFVYTWQYLNFRLPKDPRSWFCPLPQAPCAWVGPSPRFQSRYAHQLRWHGACTCSSIKSTCTT